MELPDSYSDEGFNEYIRTVSEEGLMNLELKWESLASALEKECSLKHREAANARSLAAVARWIRVNRGRLEVVRSNAVAA